MTDDERIRQECVDASVAAVKETFENYLAEHRREHASVAAGMEVRLQEHQHAHDREHIMREEALKERESKLDQRLVGMNEMREQLNRQAATFLRIETADARFGAMEGRMASIEKMQAERSGLVSKTEGMDARLNVAEKALVAHAGLPAKVDNLEAKVTSAEKQLQTQAGQRGGTSATIGYIVMGLGVLLNLMGLFTILSGM